MHYLILLALAIHRITAAVLAPLQTPAPELALRQDATSPSDSPLVQSTYAYYSGGESDGVTLWAPITYATETYGFTSSGDYWRGCSSSYIYSMSSYASAASTDCPLWTSCSMGYLLAESTSYYCVEQSYSCFTELLYTSYGAPDALSWLYCESSSANATNTAYYKEKPPAQVSKTDATSATTSASSTANPGSSPITPTPTPTPPSGSPLSTSPATPGKTNNVPIIAGSVVGGVAVLALAGVAVLYILRRNRREGASAATAFAPGPAPGPASGPASGPVSNYPTYQAEKPVGHVNVGPVPEYNPHASAVYSMGSTSPTMQSPVPAYTEGWSQPNNRNELAG